VVVPVSLAGTGMRPVSSVLLLLSMIEMFFCCPAVKAVAQLVPVLGSIVIDALPAQAPCAKAEGAFAKSIAPNTSTKLKSKRADLDFRKKGEVPVVTATPPVGHGQEFLVLIMFLRTGRARAAEMWDVVRGIACERKKSSRGRLSKCGSGAIEFETPERSQNFELDQR
jgi:hypothetical protein